MHVSYGPESMPQSARIQITILKAVLAARAEPSQEKVQTIVYQAR